MVIRRQYGNSPQHHAQPAMAANTPLHLFSTPHGHFTMAMPADIPGLKKGSALMQSCGIEYPRAPRLHARGALSRQFY
jgi:hypothetical protein